LGSSHNDSFGDFLLQVYFSRVHVGTFIDGGRRGNPASKGLGANLARTLAVGVNLALLLALALSASHVANRDLSLLGRADLGLVVASSGLHVAGIFSAGVSVVAGQGSEDAVSSEAGSGGALVGGLALFLDNASNSLDEAGDGAALGDAGRADGLSEEAISGLVVALEAVSVSVLHLAGLLSGDASSLGIAEAGAAEIGGGLADDLLLDDALLGVAGSLDALVVSVVHADGLVDALSGLDVAPISGAEVIIVAVHGLVDASAGILVARVLSAGVEVVASLGNVLALSSDGIADILGAGISVIAGLAGAEHASSSGLVTSGGSALVVGVAGEAGEHASLDGVAGIDGALNSVIADHLSLDNLSGSGVASVGVALVVSIHLGDIELGQVDASGDGIAGVSGAGVVVIASSDGVDAVSILIAGINGARS